MAEQFRVTVAGQPRGVWRDDHRQAMQDAIDLGLASKDQERRTWFLAVPVTIERRGQPEPPPPPYPSRRPRHREAWNDEDLNTLRRIARDDGDIIAAAAYLGRSREAVSRKAQQLGVRLKESANADRR